MSESTEQRILDVLAREPRPGLSNQFAKRAVNRIAYDVGRRREDSRGVALTIWLAAINLTLLTAVPILPPAFTLALVPVSFAAVLFRREWQTRLLRIGLMFFR